MAEQRYTAADGDCMSSIAFDHGFFWRTLWDHAGNAALKGLRKDPNILLAGDVVVIPDPDPSPVAKPAGARHTFKLKGVPAKLRLRLVKNKEPPPPPAAGGDDDAGGLGSGLPDPSALAGGGDDDDGSYTPPPPPPPPEVVPRANEPFTLEVDGAIVARGTTDGDGHLEASLPPNARQGRLIVNPGTADQTIIPLQLGGVDPIDTVSGVRRRLANLKYLCVPTGDQVDDDLTVALQTFQTDNGLTVTGQVDGPTKDKLKAMHGC